MGWTDYWYNVFYDSNGNRREDLDWIPNVSFNKPGGGDARRTSATIPLPLGPGMQTAQLPTLVGETDWSISEAGPENLSGVSIRQASETPTAGNRTYSSQGGSINGSGLSVAPDYSAKSRSLKNEIMGRRSELDTILEDLLSRAGAMATEKTDKRRAQLKLDLDDLLNEFNQSAMGIDNSFASLGLTGSTFHGDKRKAAADEKDKTQKSIQNRADEDLAEISRWKTGVEEDARNMNRKGHQQFDDIANMDASSNNFYNFQKGKSNIGNFLSDLTAQKNKLGTDGEFTNRLNAIGMDTGSRKLLDELNATVEQLANVGRPSQDVAQITGEDKKKKKLTEQQINNPNLTASY